MSGAVVLNNTETVGIRRSQRDGDAFRVEKFEHLERHIAADGIVSPFVVHLEVTFLYQ